MRAGRIMAPPGARPPDRWEKGCTGLLLGTTTARTCKTNQREDSVDSGPNPEETNEASHKQQPEKNAHEAKDQRRQEAEERQERRQIRHEEREDREQVRQEEREEREQIRQEEREERDVRNRERGKARGEQEGSSGVRPSAGRAGALSAAWAHVLALLDSCA